MCAYVSQVTDVLEFLQEEIKINRQANRSGQREDAHHQLSRFATGAVIHHTPDPKHECKHDREDNENQMERLK